MYDWEEHYDCSYKHLGSDYLYAVDWAGAGPACTAVGGEVVEGHGDAQRGRVAL